MTKELATITVYAPPFYEERAWNPEGCEPRELSLFLALQTRNAAKIDKAMADLRKHNPELRKPYGKTRAFALDFHPDIVATYDDTAVIR